LVAIWELKGFKLSLPTLENTILMMREFKVAAYAAEGEVTNLISPGQLSHKNPDVDHVCQVFVA